MDSFAIAIVLLSAVMHAGWNFISKAKAPSSAFFAMATVASVVAMTPLFFYLAPYFSQVSLLVWALTAGTGFLHTLYFISLAGAYRRHDISLVYPLARALPVLMVPLICLAFGYGKPLSSLAMLGMMITAAGCLVLPLQSITASFFKQYFDRSLLVVLLTACSTAGYTILDSMSLEQLKIAVRQLSPLDATLFLSAFQNLFMLLFLAVYVSSVPTEKHHWKTLRRQPLRFPIAAGLICTAAYMLVLLAMQFASNVSYVVAFRQTSILIGFLLGIFLLQEKITSFKISGAILIFVGLVLAAVG